MRRGRLGRWSRTTSETGLESTQWMLLHRPLELAVQIGKFGTGTIRSISELGRCAQRKRGRPSAEGKKILLVGWGVEAPGEGLLWCVVGLSTSPLL